MEKLSLAVEEWELYNNGILLCKWFDSETDIEDIYDYVRKVKNLNGLNGNDLELFNADWENDFLKIVNESSNIEEVFNTYNNLDLNEQEIGTLSFLTEYQGYSVKEALNHLEDVEIYEVSNFFKLAEQFVEEGLFGVIPDNIVNYLDYEAIGRDLSYDNYVEYGGKIYRVN